MEQCEMWITDALRTGVGRSADDRIWGRLESLEDCVRVSAVGWGSSDGECYAPCLRIYHMVGVAAWMARDLE